MMQMCAAYNALVGSTVEVIAEQDLSCIGVLSKMYCGHVLHDLATFRAVILRSFTNVEVSM